MTEPIEILGYAKTDVKEQQYFFFRSSEEDCIVNLKDFVIFAHPFKTDGGKDKCRLILRPANNQPKGE